MKAFIRLMMAVALVALPTLAVAGDDDEGTTTGKMWLGGWYASETDSPDAVSEYQPTDGGPMAVVKAATHQDWGSLFVAAHYTSSDESQGALDFDIYRVLRSTTTFDKLFHRLGHDPMTNLEGTSTNGKVVLHTDLNPNQDYDLTYSVLHNRTELQLPNLSALTLAVEFREQKRNGHAQAYTTSHCDTCHIYSRSHTIDEKTSDATIEAKVAWQGGFVKGSMTSRQLRQGYSNVMSKFDDALHPELQVPVFDNRLQYDSEVGLVPADLWPDMDKDIGRLDLHFDDVAGFVINGGGVWSETENKYTGLKSDYSGYMLNAARAFGKSSRLRWRGRVYTMDNDDVFVDTIERVTMAGAHAGQTYEDVYGINFDWWRLSALNRDVLESKLDYSYRLGSAAGTVKFFWDFETIDRDNYQVLPGEYETTTNTYGLSWRGRPMKGLKLNAKYTHADIDNPFMLIDGACSTLESPGYPNPWSPETPQYNDQHDARIAETTASPSAYDEFKAGISYSVGSMTVSGTYRWWDGDNSDGDLTDWSRSNQNATLTLWSAPAENWDWYLAYAWQDSELNSRVCIPVFDG